MFIISRKKLLFLFSLIILCTMLFGSGCVKHHGETGSCGITCLYGLGCLLNPLYEHRDTNKHIMQIDSFSLCSDQKANCWDGKRDFGFFTIMIPYRTNVKKLVAHFKYQGDKVYVDETEQISGETVNDFTYPVVYRVQSRSGSSSEYYVRVITAPEKTICEFFLTADLARWYGIINHNSKTISVRLPSGIVTDYRKSYRKKLKANIIYSGSSIAGPEENDFTSPVVYTVKAKDGSSVDYTVTVTTVPDKTIYEFMIDTYFPFCPRSRHCADSALEYCISCTPPDTLYKGHIDQENKLITVNLPDRNGIDVKKLKARFKCTGGLVYGGKTWVPNRVYVNDFTSPVIYRLQARDGSSAEYTVTVNIIPEKTITEFFLSECLEYCEKYYGVIDEKAKTISVVLPDDKKGALSSLKANFTYSGSSVFVDKTKQISGITENDFSSPVVYTVQAKDGSLANYTVTVTFSTDARKI